MHLSHLYRNTILAISLACVAAVLIVRAQTTTKRPMITERINENRLHRLAGNTRPEARAENDKEITQWRLSPPPRRRPPLFAGPGSRGPSPSPFSVGNATTIKLN